jgi:hypothetical protein
MYRHHVTLKQEHCHLTPTLRPHLRVEIKGGTIDLTVRVASRRKMLKISSVIHQAALRVPLIVKFRCRSTRMPPTSFQIHSLKDLLHSCRLLLAICLVSLGVQHLTFLFPTTSSEQICPALPQAYMPTSPFLTLSVSSP